MIDLHCHVLPQVDDGSGSLEESMKMIDIAYNDGIRKVVATPHRNHPVEFKYNGNIEEAFLLLNSEVKKRYSDVHLYFGAELFITKDFIDVLDNKPYDFTINNSRYVLIEFDVSASFSFIQDAIHELKVRGFIPILAHVEYYEALFENLERIRLLRDEEVGIQVTSSNLIGKNGKQMQAFVQGLVTMGLVDIVSSDAHKSNFRRPLLKGAYDLTVELSDEIEANRIFIDNQQAVIDDRSLIKTNIKSADVKDNNKRNLARYFAGAAIIVLIGVVIIMVLNRLDDMNGNSTEPPTTLISTDINPETTMIPTEESSVIIETTTITATTDSSTTPQSSVVETNVSKETIEEVYMNKLLIYQQEYENQLDSIVGLIIDARETIQDADDRKTIVEDYLNDIINLEEQADIRVYQALYELQNELEAYGYDVFIVQEMRDEYHRIKEEKTQYYLDQI